MSLCDSQPRSPATSSILPYYLCYSRRMKISAIQSDPPPITIEPDTFQERMEVRVGGAQLGKIRWRMTGARQDETDSSIFLWARLKVETFCTAC